MRPTNKIILSLLLAAWLGAFALPGQAQTATPAPEPEDLLSRVLALKGDAARGEAEFTEQACALCHRTNASGRRASNTPRLSGQHAAVIIKQVLDIRSGLRTNPTMQPLVTEELLSLQTLADIAAHLQALPVTGTIAMGPGAGLAKGKALFERDCAGCHGAAADGNVYIFAPMLASQHYTYLLREMELIRDGKRGNSNPAMAMLLQTYAAEDFQAVADYLAQLPPSKRQ